MHQIETDGYWKEILEKFSKHKGTIASFCKKHNVNQHRLYHQRTKLKDIDISTFHAINLEADIKNDFNPENAKEDINPSNEIRIEIGKAKIFIANKDVISLSNVLKEISKNC